MTPLTNNMIIQDLKENSPLISIQLIIIAGMILIFGIIYFFKLKKEQNSGRKRDIIRRVIIITFVFSIPLFKGNLEYSAIQYSIKNNCFEVVTDTVARTTTSKTSSGNTTYYVYLTNNGKVDVSSRTYYASSDGTSVYVVIAKGRFGGKYPTEVYLTSNYQYVNK